MSLDGFGVFAVTTGLATESTRDNSLDGINTIVLKSGAFGWVQTGGAAIKLFRLDREDNTTVPNGTTIIKPLTGPGRWKQFGNGAAVCLMPLFRTIYVDKNTTTDPADQNGAISCPYDGIQKALDTIPPLPTTGTDEEILDDARQGFVLLIAPGYYNEAVVMPQVGRMIILRALGGMAQPSFVPLGTPSGLGPIEGPPVLIEGGPTAGIMVDYSFLDGLTTQTSICPYYQFEGILSQDFTIRGDAADLDIMAGCIISWRDCWNIFLDDDSEEKFNGQLDFRNTFTAFTTVKKAGVVSERSHFGFVGVERIRAEDSTFDDLEALLDLPGEAAVLLTDCNVTTAYSSPFFFGSVRHDTVTEYLVSLAGTLATNQKRRVESLVGNGYFKLIRHTFGATSFVAQLDTSWYLLTNPNAASRTAIIPGLVGSGSGADFSHPSLGSPGSQMSRVVAIKNSNTSDAAGDVLIDPSGTTEIDNAPTRVLSPGEGLILIADGANNNWEIFASF